MALTSVRDDIRNGYRAKNEMQLKIGDCGLMGLPFKLLPPSPPKLFPWSPFFFCHFACCFFTKILFPACRSCGIFFFSFFEILRAWMDISRSSTFRLQQPHPSPHRQLRPHRSRSQYSMHRWRDGWIGLEDAPFLVSRLRLGGDKLQLFI